jgi:hypothetical protein
MLPEYAKKVKKWIGDNRADLFTSAMIFLIGMASFGLGRLSSSLPLKEPIRIEDSSVFEEQSSAAPVPFASASGKASSEISSGNLNQVSPKGSFVASKSGSAYYAVWCSGVSRIREENKVWFQTKEEAKAQGYRPAKNCPGL